jgi:hypothetical protein
LVFQDGVPFLAVPKPHPCAPRVFRAKRIGVLAD